MAQKIQLVFASGPRIATIDCTLNVPMEDGTIQQQGLKVKCELLTNDEVNAFYADGGTKDAGLLARIVKGFPELMDEDGVAPEFETAKQGLLGYPYVSLGILQSYMTFRAGVTEKN